MSESLPAIGVITAPAIKYEERIQDDVLYEMPKSLIKSGMAGKTIVSPYMVTRASPHMIARANQACDETKIGEVWSPLGSWDLFLFSFNLVLQLSTGNPHYKSTKVGLWILDYQKVSYFR